MARSGSRNLGERWVWNTPSLFANEPAKALAGAMNSRVNTEHSHVEHVYWIGRIFRGVGYAGEAASPVMESGFSGPGLHRRYARHLAWKTVSSPRARRHWMRTRRYDAWPYPERGSFPDREFNRTWTDEYYKKYVGEMRIHIVKKARGS